MLATLDTDGIPPTAQTIEVETILRDDVVDPRPDRGRGARWRPRALGDHFVVPAILGGRRTPTARPARPARRERRTTTRLHAHAMSRPLRSGERQRGRAARCPRGAHRATGPARSTPGSRSTRRAPGPPRRPPIVGWRRHGGRGAAALEALPALLGVPVALKDLVVTRGRPSTAGSRILEGYVGAYDAHIAERLDAAGAVILGKTNMDEFAMGSSTEHCAWGPVANPWDLSRVPGRLVRRLRGGGRGVPRPARHRDGHRWLDPPARGADRHGRPATHLRSRVAARHHRVRVIAGPGGPVRARRPRCGTAAAVVAGHDARDSTSAPEPVPDYAGGAPGR